MSSARLHISPHTNGSQRLICSAPITPPRWIPLSIYRRIDEITFLYVEAKELLDFAQRHYDTIYFQQDLCRAKEAVTTTLKTFEAFHDSLPDEQRCYVLNSLGKRMDELVAFEQNLKDLPV
ncbi:hypothetical protein C0Q70_01023 [Pomacea canaliculata]|uniref:Uncharacterized protein n=2 Tax=Pomacea canaliculata TaxID=400727 RepID=A0A2T7PYC4_POMCA|nr:hypothetical protein C0Q70_01023 [Pomacea canaliculata]